MKRLVFSVLSLFFLILLVPHVTQAAEESISLSFNGKLMTPEVSPRLSGNTTMVPVRIVSEQMGAKVTWLGDERKVSIKQENKNILLAISSKVASVNGTSTALEQPVIIVAGNTLVPVRFVAEQLGLQVEWNGATRSVNLLKNVIPAPVNPPANTIQLR
jgi:N-acetylmuramoyl-L-alanine amidase